jgi:hypothetical protein
LIGPAAADTPAHPARMHFTSGREPPPALGAALAQFGIAA